MLMALSRIAALSSACCCTASPLGLTGTVSAAASGPSMKPLYSQSLCIDVTAQPVSRAIAGHTDQHETP